VSPCDHSATVTRQSGPHLGEYCVACDHWLRWVSKSETGAERRSVSSRRSIKPKVRARVLDRFAHACMSCGAMPPAVMLQVDHIIPVDLAKRHGVYDDLIEDDLNLAPFCEECNLGKGADVFSSRSIRLMHRCLVVAQKRASD